MWPFDKLTTGIISEKIAEGLDGNDGAGEVILFRNGLLEKYDFLREHQI